MTAVASAERIGLWRSEDHKYSWGGGPWMPGVTSIISMVDKSGPLIGWAKGVTADTALDNLDRIVAMVKEDGRAPTKAWLTAHATQEKDSAADLGTRIHVLTEQLDRGGEPDIAPEHRLYIDAYHRFLEDWQPQFKSRERYVASLEHGYGGTFDFLAVIDGKVTLGDLKSGKAHYTEARLQLAGLSHAEFLGIPGDPKQYRLPVIDQCVILHVRPEAYERGYQLYRIDVNESDWAAFLGALAVYRWANERPSKGEPMRPSTNGVTP